jgi:hypothetical protein
MGVTRMEVYEPAGIVFGFRRRIPPACFYVHYFEHSLYEIGKCREYEHVMFTLLLSSTIDSADFLQSRTLPFPTGLCHNISHAQSHASACLDGCVLSELCRCADLGTLSCNLDQHKSSLASHTTPLNGPPSAQSRKSRQLPVSSYPGPRSGN